MLWSSEEAVLIDNLGNFPLFWSIMSRMNNLSKKSDIFLSVVHTDDFPEVLEAAKFIQDRRWVVTIPRTPIPANVAEFRDRIAYSNLSATDHLFHPVKFRYTVAAILFLFPTNGYRHGLRMLWEFLEQVSLLGIIYSECQNITSNADILELITNSGTLIKEIRYEIAHVINPALNIIEKFWEDHTSPLYQKEEVFLQPNYIQRIRPRVINRVPDCQLDEIVLFIPKRSLKERPVESIYNRLHNDRFHLLFSGGYHLPIRVLSDIDQRIEVDPAELPEGFSPDTHYLVRIAPTESFNGNNHQIQCGPLSLVPPSLIQAIQDFLNELLHNYPNGLGIYSMRYWIPWDKTEKNFLWVGSPLMNFSIPEWIMVGQSGNVSQDQSPYAVPVELWGAEDLEIWLDDGRIHNIYSIAKNHVLKTIEFPRTMALIEEAKEDRYGHPITLSHYQPRRYNNQIHVTNSGGSTNESFETGVSYPLKIRYLGSTYGQTICSGSESPYTALQFTPRARFWEDMELWEGDILPPLVSNKWTRLCVFAEHNAPPPYFCPEMTDELVEQYRSEYCIVGILDYSLKKASSNIEVLRGSVGAKLFHAGVLSTTDPPRVTSIQKYDEDIRNRGTTHVFTIPFYPPQTGTYTLECTLDFRNFEKDNLGIITEPVTFQEIFSLDITQPNQLELNWVKVKAGGRQGLIDDPVSDEELDRLEEWLEVIVPSVNIYFQRKDTITIKNPQIEENKLFEKLLSICQDRSGVFIAVITRNFLNQLPNIPPILTQSGGALTGKRVAWASTGHMSIPHEMGHALGFNHLPGCGAGPPYQTPKTVYSRHGKPGWAPVGYTGEHPLLPISLTNGFPNHYSLEGFREGLLGNDIMNWCGINQAFELIKCIRFHAAYFQ